MVYRISTMNSMRCSGRLGAARFAVVLLFAAGIGIGWLLRGPAGPAIIHTHGSATATAGARTSAPLVPPAHTARSPGANGFRADREIERARVLLEEQRFAEAVNLLQDRFARFTPDLEQMLLLAQAQHGSGDFEGEVDTLFQARLLVDGDAADQGLAERIRQAVDEQGKALIAQNRWGDLDLFYESLISREPENGAFYLLLGQLRLRMGRIEEAFDPLARIEHDPAFGTRAQALLARLQRTGGYGRARARGMADGTARRTVSRHGHAGRPP